MPNGPLDDVKKILCCSLVVGTVKAVQEIHSQGMLKAGQKARLSGLEDSFCAEVREILLGEGED